MDHTRIVDAVFPIRSRQRSKLPLDHGYLLYSAISAIAPGLHQAGWGLGVFPIENVRKVSLLGCLETKPESHLRLRLPIEKIPDVMCLSGQTLSVGESLLKLSYPSLFGLKPCESLDSRIVTFNLTTFTSDAGWDKCQELFEDSLRRHLVELGVTCEFKILGKQSLSIKGGRRRGFTVRCFNFADPTHSVILQALGVGGKRSMGCGLFRVTRVWCS